MKAAGHPHDSGQELFASAFMIHQYYFNEFSERIQNYGCDKRELALDVMEIVRASLEQK